MNISWINHIGYLLWEQQRKQVSEWLCNHRRLPSALHKEEQIDRSPEAQQPTLTLTIWHQGNYRAGLKPSTATTHHARLDNSMLFLAQLPLSVVLNWTGMYVYHPATLGHTHQHQICYGSTPDRGGQTRQHLLDIPKCVSGYTYLTSSRPSLMMSVLWNSIYAVAPLRPCCAITWQLNRSLRLDYLFRN